MAQPRYVSLVEAARRLGISTSTLYVHVRRVGVSGTVRMADGRWLLPEDSVDQLRRAGLG